MIFFTSDIHFYHTKVIKYCNRPFTSVEEMNEIIVKNWNDTVSPEDTVYFLGDFSLAARPVETFTPRLNGKKYMIPGNHDFVHSYNKKSRSVENREKWIKQYTQWGWTVLPEQTTLEVPGLEIINMCHLPYKVIGIDDGYDDKYEKWRPVDDGRWLICGHVHEKWKLRANMINVGVDQWGFKPVSLEEIIKIICTQQNTP